MSAAEAAGGAQPPPPASRGKASMAFAALLLLMVVDHVDRQIVVSALPALKRDGHRSDTQLGALVPVVSIAVALGVLPFSPPAGNGPDPRAMNAPAHRASRLRRSWH